MAQFHVNNIIPRPGIDKPIFVRAVDVFRRSIVIEIIHRPGRSSDFMLSKTLEAENEKYAMRTWIVRLGMSRKNYGAIRHYLLKNLDGNSA